MTWSDINGRLEISMHDRKLSVEKLRRDFILP